MSVLSLSQTGCWLFNVQDLFIFCVFQETFIIRITTYEKWTCMLSSSMQRSKLKEKKYSSKFGHEKQS